jgi:hypothetical protein
MSSGPGDAHAEPSRRGADWGRVADGVFLAGLGIFFLLATTRGLPDGFWVDAISFWPVLLVSAGIRIIFEKTPLAFGVVLGPLVVLGTLYYIAWGNRPPLPPPAEWRSLSAEEPEGVDRARLLGDLAGVQISVEARPLAPGLVAEGRAASREGEPRLRVSDDGGEASLRLHGRRGGFLLVGMRKEVWDLGVTDSLPLSIDLDGAFLKADFDLRKGQATDTEMNGAFNAVTLRLPPPTRRVHIRFGGAFSLINVIVPEGTPVHYRGPGFPISFGDRGLAGDPIPEGTPGYEVVLDGAFAVLDIDEGPAPEGGWPARPRPSEGSETAAPAGDTPPAEEPSGVAPPAEAAPRPPAEDPGGAQARDANRG